MVSGDGRELEKYSIGTENQRKITFISEEEKIIDERKR
jgi:hypothetical protein